MRASNAGIRVGVVRALYRYPVKSMRGEAVEALELRCHGCAGDRRYAFVRGDNGSSFPWLTGRQIPDLLRYAPYFAEPDDPLRSAVRVRTPAGRDLPIDGAELRAELAARYGSGVHLLQSNRGTFDAAAVSLIGAATVRALGARLGRDLDPLRFRPNILIETAGAVPRLEDRWVGGLLIFGDRDDAARVRLNQRDKRCMMIGLDPETAEHDPRVLKTVARDDETCAGVYGSTERPGVVRVGDTIRLVAGDE